MRFSPLLALLIVLTVFCGPSCASGGNDRPPSTAPATGSGPSGQAAKVPGRRGRRDRLRRPEFFAADSVWNARVDRRRRLDPRSAEVVDALLSQVREFGTGFNTDKWSVPLYTVGPDQPRHAVRIIDTGNQELRDAFAAVPIPDDARAADGTDGRLTIYQPSTDTMWDMFRARRDATGWQATYGGRMLHVSRHPGHFRDVFDSDGRKVEGHGWGGTAAGFAYMGGVVTFRDLKRGSIDHALAMAVPKVEAGVIAGEAQKTDGKYTGADTIPEGAHFRLDPRVDVDRLPVPRFVKMLARAAQRYGIVLVDGAGAVALFGQDPLPTGTKIWDRALEGLRPYQVLETFPFHRLQSLPLRTRPYS
jgi:hypothetical protein